MGEMAKEIPCQGKYSNLEILPQGILYAQVVNSLILKIKVVCYLPRNVSTMSVLHMKESQITNIGTGYFLLDREKTGNFKIEFDWGALENYGKYYTE